MSGFTELRQAACRFFFQAEDGIRDVERSRGLGDVYKRQDGGGIIGFAFVVLGLGVVLFIHGLKI